MRPKRHLTIDEKRDWLAGIFRDESGEVSHADKFKAMAEDTRLAMLEEEERRRKESSTPALNASLLDLLPPPLSPAAGSAKPAPAADGSLSAAHSCDSCPPPSR